MDILSRQMETPFQKRMYRMLLFILKLTLLSIPLYLIMAFINLSPVQFVVATNVHLILDLLGFEVIQKGALLSANNFIFFIDADCTGWKSMVFLFALLVATPNIRPRKRLIGIALGICVLWVFNIIRIITSVFLQQTHGIEVSLFVHDIVWRAGFIAIVLAFWILWMRYPKLFKQKT